ncbi:CRISPR-associated endonuclease Cas2 [Iodidimonas sp. SYSU 1G8]
MVKAQFSVFECEVDPAQWAALLASLMALIDPEVDSLRFYHLGNGVRTIEHHGSKRPLDPDGALVF